MVQLFLDHHVNIKAKDQYGLTALVYAMKKQQHEMVTMLKDAGGSY
jgi:ankyrin repeat protein